MPYALFLPTILTKHQAFTPSSPISFPIKFRLIKVEFSLRPSAKAWQEKSGPWVQLLSCSNSESSQSSLFWKSLQPRDEGWSIRSIVEHNLVFWPCQQSPFSFWEWLTQIYNSNLDRYRSSPTHQLALTMRSPFRPPRILKVFRVFVSARYSARALQGESNPVWKSCSGSKLWRHGNIHQKRRKTPKSML